MDVKNLREMMVGSNSPPVIREVRNAFPKPFHVSVTLGVAPNQAGTVALAVYGSGALGATSVKVGFVQSDYETALRILRESRRALEGFDTKLIAATFADSHLYQGIDPTLVVQLGEESRSDGMLDRHPGQGRPKPVDFVGESRLKELVLDAKRRD